LATAFPITSGDENGYGLTDAIGLQAFVLVVSESPLPSYQEWRKRLGDGPWGPTPVVNVGVFRHDGQSGLFRHLKIEGGTPGAGELPRVKQNPLDDLVEWVRGGDSRELLVDAWALPVLPREDYRLMRAD
jgi:hypothetical protein